MTAFSPFTCDTLPPVLASYQCGDRPDFDLVPSAADLAGLVSAYRFRHAFALIGGERVELVDIRQHPHSGLWSTYIASHLPAEVLT